MTMLKVKTIYGFLYTYFTTSQGRQAWILTLADDTTMFDAIAIYDFLGRLFIAAFVLILRCSTNIDLVQCVEGDFYALSNFQTTHKLVISDVRIVAAMGKI